MKNSPRVPLCALRFVCQYQNFTVTLLSFLDSSKKFCDFALPMPTRKIQIKSIKTYVAFGQ